MTRPLNETIWLTPAAHAELVAELENLTRTAAPAPEIEARIREIKRVLGRADVAHKPDDGLVEPGMTVTVMFDGDQDSITFLLAQRGIALATDPGIDVYSPTSRFGEAITGKYPGDEFVYEAPSGATVRGRIVAARPFGGPGADR